MAIIAELGATRTSHRWQTQPGNWDRLNTRALFASTNEWGIPDLTGASQIPDKLIPYSDRYACDTSQPGQAVHFFLDDYRFETVWSKPERALSRVQRVGMALTPDFSLWREMPLSMQLWQVYRARWCGAWMQHHGVAVIPTISWSTKASYKFCFEGLAGSPVVAVSTVGTTGEETKALFFEGLDAMFGYIAPRVILCYGSSLRDELPARYHDVNFVYFDTFWKGR